MQNILITGSSGFIGSNILDNLLNNCNIYVTSRKKIIYKRGNIKLIYFKNHNELNKKLKKIKIDTIIHCGTHYVKNHTFADIKKLLLANIEFGIIIWPNLKDLASTFGSFSKILKDKASIFQPIRQMGIMYKRIYALRSLKLSDLVSNL